MISNNNDLYDTIQSLSNQPSDAGAKGWSAALNNALSISSVPGEVLGEIRVQLQKLRSVEFRYASDSIPRLLKHDCISMTSSGLTKLKRATLVLCLREW